MTPWWVRLCRPLRNRELRRKQQIVQIDVCGEDHLLQARADGAGVLITPNHSAHYDSNCLYVAAERFGVLCHFLTAWQVFGVARRWEQLSYQWHGCFSIDREDTDVRAYKQAVAILQSSPYPLVIFPEGDIHHVSERVMPFRDGAAAIALSAAKKSPRPIVCVPCGIKFRYLDDPTASIAAVLGRLEDRLFLRRAPHLALTDRVWRLAEVLLAIKELDETGQTGSGPLPRRLRFLAETILTRVGTRQGRPTDGTIPERVKDLRRRAIQRLEDPQTAAAEREKCLQDLDDLFLIIQLYSYPGDYLVENPTIERLAETVDKLEEDVLDAPLPTVHGRRAVTIQFGEPIPIQRESGGRNQTAELTSLLERRVQDLLTALASATS